MRSIPFLFREALVNLRRHGLMTVAAITTIAVALALIGSFLLTFYQTNVATQHAVDDFEMRVFLPADGEKGADSPFAGAYRRSARCRQRSLRLERAGVPRRYEEHGCRSIGNTERLQRRVCR